MYDDYEIPIPYSGQKRVGDEEEDSSDSSDSDFMDVRRIRPALPDTIPVKLDEKTATMFVHPPLYHSSNSRWEQRRMTDSPDEAKKINNEVNLRRAVSFAACEANSVRNKRDDWRRNNNVQIQHSATGRGNSFLPVPVEGKPLDRASSSNSIAYVVSVQEPLTAVNYPPFVTPNSKSRGLVKSRTFNEGDKRKNVKKDLVQIRSISQNPSLNRGTHMTRANLRDSAIDLVSDEEDSEAYAAVSLAGTLSRNGPKLQTPKSRLNKRLLVIIGVLSVFVVILIVTVVTVLVLKL